MFCFFKKIKSNIKKENQFCIQNNIDAKLVFLIFTTDNHRHTICYDIKFVKNYESSIVVLAQNNQNVNVDKNDISSVILSKKLLTFDLANLNKHTQIYFDGIKNEYVFERPINNHYISPCGVITCLIKNDNIDFEHQFTILKNELINSVLLSLPSCILDQIKE